MGYLDADREIDEEIKERFGLSLGRIREMKAEETVREPFRSYFIFMAGFAEMVAELWEAVESGAALSWSLKEREGWNRLLYQDILPGHYGVSYANPVYCVERMGEGLGRLLSFFYTEMRGAVVFAYERRLAELTALLETMIEIYNLFETAGDGAPDEKEVREVVYWHISDYCDQTQLYRIREGLDPAFGIAKDIILNEDLGKPDYLYRFGEYISEAEVSISRFLAGLPEEAVRVMADTYTEGYRRGFAVMGRDLSKKRTVGIRYELGFERVVRRAIQNFREMGLEPILCRAPVQALFKIPGRKAGYHGTSPNRQWEYDHRFDSALFLDKRLKERRLSVLKTAYAHCAGLAADYAGPAVMETFGEPAFSPENHHEACVLTPKQEALTQSYTNEAAQIANGYIPGDETSFTIIAWPVPSIGPDFEAIFHETIRINTLDYEVYKEIQQKLIDVLDQAGQVEVTGRGGNETCLKVSLCPLADPKRETLFENCVADVNIPLGEVFTSPRLSGTEGLLHVGHVCIGELEFKDLRIWFKDGMVKDYSCGNFDSKEEGKALVKQMILKNHGTLPMGEFAIGTNTTAYAMARRFGIGRVLPILIAEKMGPHFAVGDTCYSWAEDSPVYNPDGKEMVARDNEVSLLRREDVSRAYFGCHTDITIPYSELGDIVAVTEKGGRLPIIREGRFVVPGTELLNRELG